MTIDAPGAKWARAMLDYGQCIARASPGYVAERTGYDIGEVVDRSAVAALPWDPRNGNAQTRVIEMIDVLSARAYRNTERALVMLSETRSTPLRMPRGQDKVAAIATQVALVAVQAYLYGHRMSSHVDAAIGKALRAQAAPIAGRAGLVTALAGTPPPAAADGAREPEQDLVERFGPKFIGEQFMPFLIAKDTTEMLKRAADNAYPEKQQQQQPRSPGDAVELPRLLADEDLYSFAYHDVERLVNYGKLVISPSDSGSGPAAAKATQTNKRSRDNGDDAASEQPQGGGSDSGLHFIELDSEKFRQQLHAAGLSQGGGGSDAVLAHSRLDMVDLPLTETILSVSSTLLPYITQLISAVLFDSGDEKNESGILATRLAKAGSKITEKLFDALVDVIIAQIGLVKLAADDEMGPKGKNTPPDYVKAHYKDGMTDEQRGRALRFVAERDVQWLTRLCSMGSIGGRSGQLSFVSCLVASALRAVSIIEWLISFEAKRVAGDDGTVNGDIFTEKTTAGVRYTDTTSAAWRRAGAAAAAASGASSEPAPGDVKRGALRSMLLAAQKVSSVTVPATV